ncbi:FtsK/SpoIIIE domain-containing protein [Ornithinimicrobium flavum]|uniref:FtsK/SpoIIIE domain-containing protein n=1 Tax=Ornithinimicrobium flavum TaxID=1288636 RepID=UPI00106FF5A0|nr:FtsK/SpoIIIE domain-containing protein [Ornithinimicrobium flavum]
MKVIVTTRHGGAERHVVVEGPPGVSVEEVLSTVGARAAHAPGPRPARPVLHGDDLAVGRAREAAGAPPWIVAADGPDAGMVTSLPPGRWVSIGRDPACDLTVGDPSLSRLHVRVRLERSGVRVQDMGSTNGVAWESGAEGDVWAADDRLLLGSTSLALVTRPPAPARTTVADGRVEIVPWPREPRTIEEVRLHRPPHPERRRVRRPSTWSWGLPLAVAVAVALVLRMPWLLMFGLLGPAMVLGQHLAERRAAREEFEEACQDHRVRTRAVEETARSALAAELRVRRDADGGLTGVAGALVCGDPASSTVWACLEEVPSLVVGTGAVASGVSLDGEVLRHSCAPVVVPLDAPLAVAGPRPLRDGVMRSLLLQLASRHPPDQVTVSVDPGRFGDPGHDLGALLAWLPHTVTVSAAAAPGPTSPERRTIGWGHDLLLVEDPAAVPAGATLVVVHSATHAAVHGPDGRVRTCAPTLLGPSAARSMVRRLAPLRLASGHDTPATREEGLDSPDLLRWPADVDDVLAGWTRPGLDVVLGVDPGGAPVRIDLVRDGPHALVAGTTGSGKSELLRTLVAGLALRCSPADLALLLVDYKGGSSLGDCARLPHVTGLVTDLDPHLAERVLMSLQAELTRRESVLRSAGARDVREYSGGDLPRLVVVIDEFRVLAEEVPEVLTRLVRLAAVGRSLGVHLILATQRPAGVVSADLRANVNLRIALRVRDVADSHDVLDCGTPPHCRRAARAWPSSGRDRRHPARCR